jgi:hypothetical protein
MFRRAIFLLINFCGSSFYAQIDLISTGTNSKLTPVSILNNNIVVHGLHNYSAKSYDDCKTLIPISVPGPTFYWNYLQRLDTNISFILSTDFNSYNNKIFKSTNGGNSWMKKCDTSGLILTHLSFFDSLSGIAFSTFYKSLMTNNAGNSWTVNSHPLIVVSCAKKFGDSTICIGGGDPGGDGAFVLSNNRGVSWTLGGNYGGNCSPRDFFFLNKDTIFGIAAPNVCHDIFSCSFNGGKNWSYLKAPISNPNNIIFRKKNEGYIVGANSNNLGIILKTTDLGQTWSTFNTGINSILLCMGFLNDSIALVSGDNGVLFKWNIKQTVFTDINKNTLEKEFFIYPNPVREKLIFNSDNRIIKYSVKNTYGITMMSGQENIRELDVGILPNGIYFLEMQSGSVRKIFKLCKE